PDALAPSAAPTANEPPAPPSASALPAADGSAVAIPADAAPSGPLVMIAGGDIDLSRGTGQKILRNPTWDPFGKIRPLLLSADLRFANLECPLSDQKGITGHKDNPLVFTGPPGGAEVLTRGAFDIVSTANNHAWDYGKRALGETLQNLDRVGIAHVGTSATAEKPMGPRLIERKGHKLAFFAMTAIFNDGPANNPEPRKYVAPASIDLLRVEIERVRPQVDWVVVSLHIGQEYSNEPVQAHRKVLQGAVEAGADVVLGHHTHTPQRVEFHRGKPIAVSMGNFVFHQHSDHPWTGFGYLSRVTFTRGKNPSIEMCPYRTLAAIPQPLGPREDDHFVQHMRRISVGKHTGKLVERGNDGCWVVQDGG
ncbi:MAG TPA: CapA family protein, partial [Polyangiaceae bacterium]|nr:CapA family protein [Polyangiaceae bacterium]